MDEVKLLTLVIQGGSFSLLAVVVFWAMRWLPRRLQETDAAACQERRDHRDERQALLAAYRDEQRAQREQCANEFNVLAEGLHRQQDSLTAVAATLNGAVVLLKEHHAVSAAMMRQLDEVAHRQAGRKTT